MNLSQLLGTTDWVDVERSLLQQYPDARESLEGYRQTFSKLRVLMPTANPTRLCIRPTLRPGLDDQPFPEVLGRNGTLNRDLDDFRHLGEAEDSTYALSEAEFALDFEPWNEWLGMEIEADTLEKYLASEIAAHCLQEMTFFGFDEDDIGAERAELDRRVDELNAMQARPCWSPPIDRIGHVGTLNLWRDESDNQAENEIHP